jgi:Family of unknown function (DUF6644)
MLLEFCTWLQDTAFSTGIRESVWTFPIIETVHLMALAFSVGIIVLVDLRLIGVTLRDRPVSEVFTKLQPMAVKGFGINVVSGVLLFVSEPVKCYHSTYFLIKCILLFFLAVNAWGFDRFTLPGVAAWDKAIAMPFGARLAGWVSLTFWLGVIVMGRAIAYAGH